MDEDTNIEINGLTLEPIPQAEPQPQAELPRWKCHKEVHAVKITGVVDPTAPGNESDGGRLLEVAGPYLPIYVRRDFVQKHKPEAGGYYVVYDDGYTSYSPAKAFENGYTPV